MALKGNQGTLHDDVRSFLDDPETKLSVSDSTVDGDHGRIETRTAMVSTDISWLQKDHRWPGLAAVDKIVRVRETADKTTTESAYYLLSKALVPAEPHGQRTAQPRRLAAHGAQPDPYRNLQRLAEEKAPAGRMERWLSG